MKKTLYVALALLIIGANLSGFIYSAQRVHADDSVDPDDPTAVWACYPDTDANGNPIQTCGFGHYQQDCSYVGGVQSCEQDFEPDPPSGAALFAPIAQQLASSTSFSLSGSWNGTQLVNSATTSLSIGKAGILSWSYAPTTLQPRIHGAQSFADLLSTATLTLDLYKGVMGSSTLVSSQTVSSSTSGTFPATFDTAGPYFIAFSATYPHGSYPPGESPADVCVGSGDLCNLPSFSLTDFQNAMTQGDTLESNGGDLGNYIPAAYGLLPLTIAAGSVGPLASNVLFLPGTMESRLYMKTPLGEKELWEPFIGVNVASLAINPDGTSQNNIYTRDIIDHLYSDNPTIADLVASKAGNDSIMYGPFEDFMDGLVTNGTIKQWQAYPYDWRYDVSDIVKNGTLVGTATTSPTRVYLQNIVQALASSSPTGKVTIVAHSNGGLLAKALAVELQKEGKIALLDRIIMVGAPQVGTPLTIGSILHADNDANGINLVLPKGAFRAVSLTMPGAYDLLPSAAYFTQIQTPVVSFANDALDIPYRSTYGAEITSYESMFKFLTNVGTTRGMTDSNDLFTPAVLSSALMQKAAATHAAIDTWIAPASLSVTSIVGWGQPTISQYYYSAQPSGETACAFIGFLQLKCSPALVLKHYYATTEDGDNTVVAPSASFMGNVLYLDTKKLTVDTKINIGHQSLLSALPVQNQIKDLLENASTIEPYLQTTEPPNAAKPLLVVSVHSPVNILATDMQGNQTGIVSVPGFSDIYFLKQDIPGSSIQTLDDEKYISLPPNENYSFSVQGYDSGEMTIDVNSLDANGSSTSFQTFPDIPTTASTTATFSITQNVATAPAVDINGDGKVDLIASSSITNTSTSTDFALLDQQFSNLRNHYSLGIFLLLALEKLRLGKDADIQNAVDCLEKFMNAKIGDRLNPQDASVLQQSIAKLHL